MPRNGLAVDRSFAAVEPTGSQRHHVPRVETFQVDTTAMPRGQFACRKDAVKIMTALVAQMTQEAVANQSGYTDKADGSRGGGMHCLHVLASRSSEHFWDLTGVIEERFDKNVVEELLNVCTGDGRAWWTWCYQQM